MNLLLLALCAAFVSGLRSSDRQIPLRPIPLVLICMVVVLVYLSRKVI